MGFPALTALESKNSKDNDGRAKPDLPFIVAMFCQASGVSAGALHGIKVHIFKDTVVKVLGNCVEFFNKNSYHNFYRDIGVNPKGSSARALLV